MRFDLRILFVIVALSLGASGCENNGQVPGNGPTSGTTATPTPTASASPPGTACPALAIEGPAIVAPSPGATGVPTAAARLEIAPTYPIALNVSLVPSSGATLALGTIATPTPAPSGSPGPVGIAYPQLASATLYTVTYSDASGAQCSLAVSSGGTFTTQ